ncbi:recombinase RdgC [Gallibacterium salpingitidis]|uniref:Recombination-associated protein RdgC n=1 Tax=Gallibacterium salpingitidis TaxID=505341 RepID=A0A1A7QC05_9PAST|nr:recombination-associated protein RdgC [Gallibacterium salpingitidis]OBW94128.1 recombinase RdgC [Gallibacterium salpingitidis]OBX09122.1 recombinase RdgC [Gallibacterium salpingitidis]OBX10935.1 recombinase RdgC [Gallibacterium salpingitidis]WKS99687.1 recombination-associated protein RdgC [Gallibacterium salpingitidis]
MYWFKNILVYRLTKKLDWSSEALQNSLAQQEFTPCGSSDHSKFGWQPPLSTSDQLYFTAGGHFLLVAHREEKILPTPVIKETLDNRIQKLEEAQQRKLKKTEKQALKDDVIATLLPRAFSRHQRTALWIDTTNDLIYVDAASSKRAEDVLALLRKSLGSLPVIPFSFAEELSMAMTDWLLKDQLPQWLTCLEEGEFKDLNTGSSIRCKNQDLYEQDIQGHLAAGKVVTKLALDWENHFSFVLYEDASLKRIKFADMVKEKNDDILKEDVAQRFDADFVLMTGEVSLLMQNLIELLGEKQLA